MAMKARGLARYPMHPTTGAGRWLALLAVLAYVFAAPMLVMLTKITLDRKYMYLAFVLPLFLFAAAVMLSGDRWKRSRLNRWVLLYGGFALVQIANPRNPSMMNGVVYFVSKYSALMMYPVVILIINRERDVVRLLKVLAFTGVLGAAYSICQEIVGFPAFEDQWANSMGGVHGFNVSLQSHRRPPGLAIYSASNAVFLATVAILTIPAYLNARWGWARSLLHLSVLGAAVLLTQTRGVWVGFAIGLLFFFYSISRGSRKARRKSFQVIAAVGLAFGVLISLNEFLARRLQAFRAVFRQGHPFMTRVVGWKATFETYGGGLVWGYGTGSIGMGGSVLGDAPQKMKNLADNMYLNVLFSLGILGLLLLLVVLWRAYRTHLRNRRHLRSSFLRMVSSSAMASLLAYAVFFVTGDYLESFPGSLYFWASLGLLSTLPRLDRSASHRCDKLTPAPILAAGQDSRT